MWINFESLVTEIAKVSDFIGDFSLSEPISPSGGVTWHDLIRRNIMEKGMQLISEANAAQLDDALPLPTDICRIKNGGFIELPEDFLRLRYFKMDDWDYGVTTAVSDESLEYRLQSGIEPLRASPERPLVALVGRTHGRRLEFYGSADTAEVEKALYIPLPHPNPDGRIFLPAALIPSLISQCATPN